MAEGGADSFTVSGSEPVFDFYCEFCNENGQHLEAEGHCTECDEYLCGKCIDNHKWNRFTRNHEVLNKENMPRDTPPSPNRVRKDISTMCKQHKGEPVKYYCKPHDKLACSSCFVKDHKTCTDIINITESSSSIFYGDEYKDFIQKLTLLEKQVNDITTKSREHIATSTRCCSEAIEAVEQFRYEVNSILDDIETDLKTQADDIKTKDVSKLETLQNTCKTLKETIDKISSELESLKSENRVCQTFITMKGASADLKDIEKQIKSAEANNNANAFTFQPNTKLVEFLRGYGAFGLLSVNGNQDKKNQDTTPTSIVDNQALFNNDNNVLCIDRAENTKKLNSVTMSKVVSSASFVHDINVESTSDSYSCFITGSAVLSDSKLLIVDYNNSKLKLINTQSMSIIGELLVRPWDITVITGDHVAVTVPWQNTILVLRVTDSIIKEREIRVKGQCYGISYSKNQLIVPYCDPGTLEIMDLQGNISITIDRDKDGNQLFNRPEYIGVSNDGDTIYVSDNKPGAAGRVISLTRNGDVKSIYTDKDLKCPQKICVDHRGNVFVCGLNSNNIHMLTPDCAMIKVILDQTDVLMIGVWSVSHCRQRDRLYVGMWKNNKVRVYQLS